MPIDAPALLEAALTTLTSKYIFPEKAAEAAADVRARLAAGEYDGLGAGELCERVTAVLQEHTGGDKHLRLRPSSTGLVHTEATPEEMRAAWHADNERNNHGIERVERLRGNIGLIELRQVTDPLTGGDAIASAMRLVEHTRALIFDNRRNRGGMPEGVQLWHSYLFPDAETHLNDNYHGDTGFTRQYWTLPYVPGPRYLDRPVWVLTSGFTFSAGEEFSYNLKNLGRATLVGETTRGGAHPTEVFPLADGLEITVPIARSINPVTGTNWEGTGVTPHVAAPADGAFDVAYAAALDHVIALPGVHAATLAEAKEAREGLG